ncbi:unnamed protein product [Symbiodinium sp. CCMP2456]|nr:unnamed protein product [Symbiodinium sp. CCMP2456]
MLCQRHASPRGQYVVWCAVHLCSVAIYASCTLRECQINPRLSGILEKLKANEDVGLPTGSGRLLPPKVLENLKKVSTFQCEAILPSDQWSKDDDDIPLQQAEADAEADEQETRKCKKNKASGAKATRKTAKQSIAVDSSKPADNQCLYKPGAFQEERFKFIRRMKEKKGISYSEASAMWKTSKKRATLLSGLSESQMKKRRF